MGAAAYTANWPPTSNSQLCCASVYVLSISESLSHPIEWECRRRLADEVIPAPTHRPLPKCAMLGRTQRIHQPVRCHPAWKLASRKQILCWLMFTVCSYGLGSQHLQNSFSAFGSHCSAVLLRLPLVPFPVLIHQIEFLTHRRVETHYF
jgi:hypothetical protein